MFTLASAFGQSTKPTNRPQGFEAALSALPACRPALTYAPVHVQQQRSVLPAGPTGPTVNRIVYDRQICPTDASLKQMAEIGELEQLYNQHGQALFAFVLNFTRHEADTRDIIQE